MNATAKILRHPMYHINDYNYLTQKGYTNKEIIALWDRDLREGKAPCTLNKYEINWKKYRNGL